LKVTKLELDENVTKSKYQIENAQSENRRLRDEHNELTIERRRLVDERANLAADFEAKLRQVDELEKHLRAAQDERDTINEQAEELSVQNDELEARLAEAEKVNRRILLL